jgi:heme oxygenase
MDSLLSSDPPSAASPWPSSDAFYDCNDVSTDASRRDSGPPSSAPSRSESLLVHLKHETSAAQRLLEARATMLSAPITEQRYQQYCRALWGLHAPLEQRVRKVADSCLLLPDLERRFKLGLLTGDLAELGVVAPEVELPVCQGLPAIDSPERALGALYVLERSTLGNRHMHRYLSHVLPSMTARASRFLTGYGADTQHMWTAFGEHLMAKKALDRDAVVETAGKIFAAATAWFGHAFAREDGANLEPRPRERARRAALALPRWVIEEALCRWAPRWKYGK